VTGTHLGHGASGRAGGFYGTNEPVMFFGSPSDFLIWDDPLEDRARIGL
jgi:hypothetical protein